MDTVGGAGGEAGPVQYEWALLGEETPCKGKTILGWVRRSRRKASQPAKENRWPGNTEEKT